MKIEFNSIRKNYNDTQYHNYYSRNVNNNSISTYDKDKGFWTTGLLVLKHVCLNWKLAIQYGSIWTNQHVFINSKYNLRTTSNDDSYEANYQDLSDILMKHPYLYHCGHIVFEDPIQLHHLTAILPKFTHLNTFQTEDLCFPVQLNISTNGAEDISLDRIIGQMKHLKKLSLNIVNKNEAYNTIACSFLSHLDCLVESAINNGSLENLTELSFNSNIFTQTQLKFLTHLPKLERIFDSFRTIPRKNSELKESNFKYLLQLKHLNQLSLLNFGKSDLDVLSLNELKSLKSFSLNSDYRGFTHIMTNILNNNSKTIIYHPNIPLDHFDQDLMQALLNCKLLKSLSFISNHKAESNIITKALLLKLSLFQDRLIYLHLGDVNYFHSGWNDSIEAIKLLKTLLCLKFDTPISGDSLLDLGESLDYLLILDLGTNHYFDTRSKTIFTFDWLVQWGLKSFKSLRQFYLNDNRIIPNQLRYKALENVLRENIINNYNGTNDYYLQKEQSNNNNNNISNSQQAVSRKGIFHYFTINDRLLDDIPIVVARDMSVLTQNLLLTLNVESGLTRIFKLLQSESTKQVRKEFQEQNDILINTNENNSNIIINGNNNNDSNNNINGNNEAETNASNCPPQWLSFSMISESSKKDLIDINGVYHPLMTDNEIPSLYFDSFDSFKNYLTYKVSGIEYSSISSYTINLCNPFKLILDFPFSAEYNPDVKKLEENKQLVQQFVERLNFAGKSVKMCQIYRRGIFGVISNSSSYFTDFEILLHLLADHFPGFFLCTDLDYQQFAQQIKKWMTKYSTQLHSISIEIPLKYNAFGHATHLAVDNIFPDNNADPTANNISTYTGYWQQDYCESTSYDLPKNQLMNLRSLYLGPRTSNLLWSVTDILADSRRLLILQIKNRFIGFFDIMSFSDKCKSLQVLVLNGANKLTFYSWIKIIDLFTELRVIVVSDMTILEEDERKYLAEILNERAASSYSNNNTNNNTVTGFYRIDDALHFLNNLSQCNQCNWPSSTVQHNNNSNNNDSLSEYKTINKSLNLNVSDSFYVFMNNSFQYNYNFEYCLSRFSDVTELILDEHIGQKVFFSEGFWKGLSSFQTLKILTIQNLFMVSTNTNTATENRPIINNIVNIIKSNPLLEKFTLTSIKDYKYNNLFNNLLSMNERKDLISSLLLLPNLSSVSMDYSILFYYQNHYIDMNELWNLELYTLVRQLLSRLKYFSLEKIHLGTYGAKTGLGEDVKTFVLVKFFDFLFDPVEENDQMANNDSNPDNPVISLETLRLSGKFLPRLMISDKSGKKFFNSSNEIKVLIIENHGEQKEKKLSFSDWKKCLTTRFNKVKNLYLSSRDFQYLTEAQKHEIGQILTKNSNDTCHNNIAGDLSFGVHLC